MVEVTTSLVMMLQWGLFLNLSLLTFTMDISLLSLTSNITAPTATFAPPTSFSSTFAAILAMMTHSATSFFLPQIVAVGDVAFSTRFSSLLARLAAEWVSIMTLEMSVTATKFVT